MRIVTEDIFSLLRIGDWSKAVFVLIGVFYATALTYLGKALLAALAFCFVSSAVYIYNDLLDQEKDRLHPQKCYRPLAIHESLVHLALIMLFLLLMAGFLLAWSISIKFFYILSAYVLINLLYNHALKNIIFIDVFSIASGFLLRVLAGTVGIGLALSYWLAATATVLSLFIALCKRRLEKQMELKGTRDVLAKYSFAFLDRLIYITMIIAVTTYFFYALNAPRSQIYFLITTIFAILGLMRFTNLVMGNKAANDDPLLLFWHDSISVVNGSCFLLLTVYALISQQFPL